MKVFNWVNRRFVHGTTCVTSVQGEKRVERNGKSKADIEMHGLLDHEGYVAVDVLKYGWKEGFLSIGTLAIGPLETTITGKLKFELINKQVDNYENEDYQYNNEATNNYVVNVIDGGLDDDSESIPLLEMTLFSHESEKMDVDGSPCKEKIEQAEDIVVVKVDEKECQIKRRVTLAELFLEDSVKGTKVSPNYVAHNYYKEDCFVKTKGKSKIKPISNTKNGLSKAKKLLKEELRPIKKLNQLMKRLMKKKIHPEMVEGGKITHKEDMQKKPSKGMDIPTHEVDLDAAYDTASLLHLQGCAI